MSDFARVPRAAALAVALWAGSVGANAAPAKSRGASFAGCVPKLVGVRSRGYASQYVTKGPYAYGEWRASGYVGQSLWKRSGTLWCKVQTGVSILDRRALIAYGIPAPVAKRLLAAMHNTHRVAPPVRKPPVPKKNLRPAHPASRH